MVIPKELKEAAEQQPLLYNKQFFYSKTFENGEDFVLQDNLKEIIMQYYLAAKPMNDFLKACLN